MLEVKVRGEDACIHRTRPLVAMETETDVSSWDLVPENKRGQKWFAEPLALSWQVAMQLALAQLALAQCIVGCGLQSRTVAPLCCITSQLLRSFWSKTM